MAFQTVFLLFISSLVVLSGVEATSKCSNIVSLLQSESIIPEVVPTPFHPHLCLSIIYPWGEVIPGSQLTVADTQVEPSVNVTGHLDAQRSYTLVMTDPDAPTRADPIYREFRHWVITGLQVSPADNSNRRRTPDSTITLIKAQNSTTPYRPPGPRPDSGIHRYTFLLFEEPSTFAGVPAGAPEYGAELEQRRSWGAIRFAETYGLKLVGAVYFLIRG